MQVKRIVHNIKADHIEKADAFYRDLLGLTLAMDLEWVRTYTSDTDMQVQITVATEGGAGTPVPDMSIEVDDLNEVIQRAKKANISLAYGPVSEPWGVRRCYVRDPFGQLVNILQHE